MSRLEEIKEEYRDAIRVIGIARKDIDYLIQQAERVQELEEECAGWKEASRFNDEKLEQQNKRYREELDILGEVINSAPNADKLNEEYERLKGLEGEE